MSNSTATMALASRLVTQAHVLQSRKLDDHARFIIGKDVSQKELFFENAWIGGAAPAQQGEEGADIPRQSINTVLRMAYRHLLFGTVIEASERQQNSDLTGYTDKIGERMAKSEWIKNQIMAADILNDGTDAAVTGFDGVPLFSASHQAGQAVWSNISTGLGVMSAALIQGMLWDIQRYHKDWTTNQPHFDEGKYRLITGQGTSPFKVREILNSHLKAGTGDNDKNVIQDVEYAGMNRYVTGTAAYLLPLNDNPIRRCVRKPWTMRHDHITGMQKFGYPKFWIGECDELRYWIGAAGCQYAAGA